MRECTGKMPQAKTATETSCEPAQTPESLFHRRIYRHHHAMAQSLQPSLSERNFPQGTECLVGTLQGHKICHDAARGKCETPSLNQNSVGSMSLPLVS